MSSVWEQIAEQRILEAFEQGEFQDLPGKGQPLDLTAYFNTPSEDRLAFSILKNAGVLPGEVELMREVEAIAERLKNCSPSEAQGLKRLLDTKRVKLTLAMEKRKTRVQRGGGRTNWS